MTWQDESGGIVGRVVGKRSRVNKKQWRRVKGGAGEADMMVTVAAERI